MSAYIPALSTNTLSGYIRTVLAVPDIDREEEIELFKKYHKTGCRESAKRLILANLKLVVNLAYKFRRFRDVVDLIQEGNSGLLVALKKFDIRKGVRFATYAAWWIKAKIQEFILAHLSIVRFGKGRDERKLFFNLIATIREIESFDSGRELTRDELIEEVARRLEMDPVKVADNIKMISSASDLSINETYEDGGEKFQLADPRQGFDGEIIENDMQEAVHQAIESLNEREQYIIKNRYLTETPVTLEEIGTLYNISKERVRQIEERAIEKIRQFALAQA